MALGWSPTAAGLAQRPAGTAALKCEVYKGARKEDTYLFVENEQALQSVPPIIQKQMGEFQWVMAIDLAERKALAAARPEDVIEGIRRQGFYLQLPPGKEPNAC